MKRLLGTFLVAFCFASFADVWPDGSEMSAWFADRRAVDVSKLGKRYVVTDYGVSANSAELQTKAIQRLIDDASAGGGGVIVFPCGVYRTGGLTFKKGTHLRLEKDATIVGSDDITDYPLCDTRIEGQTCRYYGALINAIGLDGFTMSGEGTIDGNGFKSWRAFWSRRKWNPKTTNKDEQRSRNLFVWKCRNVQVEGVTFKNSQFWNTHYADCENVRIFNCRIYADVAPDGSKGPSTDAIDLDAVSNVVVSGVFMNPNDDAIALKGGKGVDADDFKKWPDNGENRNVLIENCVFGQQAHSALTLGSESVHDVNVIFRNSRLEGCVNMLNLKMRVDTPQLYECVVVEGNSGTVRRGVNLSRWSQFADFQGKKPPFGTARNVTVRNCNLECVEFVSVPKKLENCEFVDFAFSNLNVRAQHSAIPKGVFRNLSVSNLNF